MGGGGGSTTLTWADQTFAKVARDQWDDYKNRFRPVERQLLQDMTRGAPRQYVEAVGMARDANRSAFGQQPGMLDRDLGRMGLALGADQRQALDSQRQLDQTSNMVANANAARLGVDDRIMNIIGGGGLSTANRTIRGKAM